MNKIVKTLLIATFGSLLAGCYNDFDAPSPAKVYTDSDFEDLTYWSIKDVKDKFVASTGYAGNIGGVYSLVVTDDAYTRGKVISSDYAGNVYKTLYIYDEESERAIELKLTSGNYLFYPVGTIVYVKLKGLVLGNYRSMISIGTVSDDTQYSNSNIVSEVLLKEHIFTGERVGLTQADTLVVNSSNYQTRLTDDQLGRLVRFEGVTSLYGQAKWGYQNQFPNYFANSTSYDETTNPDWEVWKAPTWALKRSTNDPVNGFSETYYYGSSLFSYAGLQSTTEVGNYVVRTSAYSNFRDERIPADGATATITALYTKYTNAAGRYPTYQLVLNSVDDVEVTAVPGE